MPAPILSLRDIDKSYPQEGTAARPVLRGVTLDVRPGERVALVGRSGSGKSTLLHLAAGIDLPTRGTVELAGRDLARLSDAERTRLRRDTVGLVFQFFHLVSHLDVQDNVALPSMIAGEPERAYRPRALELLERVGLADRAGDSVEKLSGGEMQRVAICRALSRRPALLLADEPTGNLDDETSGTVVDLLLRLTEEVGSALVYATHSPDLVARADRTYKLSNGALAPLPPGDGR